MKNELLNKTFCTVTATKKVNYYEDFSCSDIIARIGDEYPKHIEDYINAEIEDLITITTTNEIRTIKLIKDIINKVLKLHDIDLQDLLGEDEITVQDDATQLSLGDLVDDGDVSINKV